MKGFSLRMARKKIISKTKAKKLLEMIDNLEVMPSGNLKHIDLADIKDIMDVPVPPVTPDPDPETVSVDLTVSIGQWTVVQVKPEV